MKKTLKIGIDAKWYFEGPVSGKNVINNIVNKLIKRDHEITLYIKKKHNSRIKEIIDQIPTDKKITFKFLPNFPNTLTNLLFFPIFINRSDEVIVFQNYVPLWKKFSTKYVAYVHDFLFFDYPQYFTLFENFFFRFMKISVIVSDYVITISKEEKKRIIKNSKIKTGKISFIYHGIDERFKSYPEDKKKHIRKRYGLPKKFILFVGRLNIRKNIKTLLLAMKNIDKNLKLVIVGPKDNDLNINLIIKKLDLYDRVKQLGHIPDDILPLIYSSAHIFVFPSFAEGFGLPPIESMRSGVPCIVTKNTSIPEICGDAAIYFDQNDANDLSSNIEDLYNDREKYTLYKIKSKIQANKYTWEKNIDEFEYLLGKLVK